MMLGLTMSHMLGRDSLYFAKSSAVCISQLNFSRIPIGFQWIRFEFSRFQMDFSSGYQSDSNRISIGFKPHFGEFQRISDVFSLIAVEFQLFSANYSSFKSHFSEFQWISFVFQQDVSGLRSDFNGFPQITVGFQSHFMEFLSDFMVEFQSGISWISMDFRGFQCISVGCQWNSLGFHSQMFSDFCEFQSDFRGYEQISKICRGFQRILVEFLFILNFSGFQINIDGFLSDFCGCEQI